MNWNVCYTACTCTFRHIPQKETAVISMKPPTRQTDWKQRNPYRHTNKQKTNICYEFRTFYIVGEIKIQTKSTTDNNRIYTYNTTTNRYQQCTLLLSI